MMHPTSHQISQSQIFPKTLIPWKKPFSSGTTTLSPLFTLTQFSHPKINNNGINRRAASTVKAISDPTVETLTSVKTVVSVKDTVGGFLKEITIDMDDITDLLGKSILLELVSAELDPNTGLEKATIKKYARRGKKIDGEVKYECDFVIPEDFGQIGAVLVENEHTDDMFVTDISFDGFPDGPFNVTCNSWVRPKSKYDFRRRIFFTNKSYLPSQTPSGLKRWRDKDLEEVRGEGQGERKRGERIFDYDVYNDLGDPDSDPELARPVLGGKTFPYPRRCRTGRPRCKTDPLSETRSSYVYVPRDEEFSEVKNMTFSTKTVRSVLKAVVPSLQTAMLDAELGFPLFTSIDQLYNEGVNIPDLEAQGLKTVLPRLVKLINDLKGNILQFETPVLFERDRFSWFRDEEFSRQTLAGLNPCCIELVTEWPLKSKLDPKIYGSPDSALTTELVEREIRGFATIDEAIKQKRLFMLDYHDLLLPYVHKVREQKGRTLYGSRTLFFLTPNGTLRPIAIELTRPPLGDNIPQWKEVFLPTWDATGCWLWRLAKAHVLAHDSGYHQLVSHWLRTHCATEPYVIATHRQLSAMHPIYRLLHPHFRYTMEINALAREALINANGIIESSFSPGKYSIEISAVAYDKQWQFDLQALPADLIHRGMAVEDPDSPHGLKLTIEDYPYANDGLILWDSIKQWVSDYVNHYYPNPSLITSDKELQAWWHEIVNVGHGDKKDAPWWPKLKTQDDLIGILTTMIWVTSGHHAAVNFGQYGYAGYFPNRPTIARKNMPTENPYSVELDNFMKKPEFSLLQVFPSQIQATTVMAVLDVLSNHSVEEEYMGEEMEPYWGEEREIKAAYERFSGSLKTLEGIIDGRNADRNLKNRCGAGVVPYELLKPFSEPGVTGKGVPNSISI